MVKFRVAGNCVVRIDNSAGAIQNMTSYIDTVSAVGKEYMPLDVTMFSDTAERVIQGIEMSSEVTVSGAFDDTATTGPDAIFGTLVGTINTFEFNPVGTVSGARKISGEFLWLSYKIVNAVKERVNFELTGKLDNVLTITTN